MPITVACPQCGKTKNIKPSHVRERNFCGRACKSTWESVNWVAEANPNFKGGKPAVKCICLCCGDEFYTHQSELKRGGGKLCSRKCVYSYWTTIRHPRDKAAVPITCPSCGKIFEVRPSIANLRSCCSRRCLGKLMSDSKRGSNNNNWKGGLEIVTKMRYERYKSDLKFMVCKRISASITQSLKRVGAPGKNGAPWQKLVGYRVEDLIYHLQRTMPDGFTWHDYLDGRLQIDHKVPVAAFNFRSVTDHDFRRCWAMANLQLLPERVNKTKGARLSAPFQPSLL